LKSPATILLAVALCAAMFHFRPSTPAAVPTLGGHIYALSYGGGTPHIELEIGGAPARAMLDYGATKSSLRAKSPAELGLIVKASTSLPFVGGREFLSRHADAETDAIIGTDLLAHLTVALYGDKAMLSTSPADAAAHLESEGFVPLDQRGFFSSDRLRVAKDRPNVPVVFAEIGGVKTWAQIDTGYDDDLYPHSLDINQALYDELVARGVTLTRQGFVTVKICAGVERRPVYSSRQALAITDQTGAPITETTRYTLIAKHANPCGGIGARVTPGAQLGASFLRLFGSIVFDPQAERVWIKRP
jgi:hypothetical protein